MAVKATVTISRELLERIEKLSQPDIGQVIDRIALSKRAELAAECYLVQMGFLKPSTDNLLWALLLPGAIRRQPTDDES